MESSDRVELSHFFRVRSMQDGDGIEWLAQLGTIWKIQKKRLYDLQFLKCDV